MTRLLDISRLLRRAGRPMTGIDRVELAYLNHLSRESDPCFALARTRLGYVLLDPSGAADMARKLAWDSFGPLDPLGRLAPHLPRARRQAEADARRLCCARALPHKLAAMLSHHLPRGTRYVNVGHANLTDRMTSALQGIDAHVAVMVHDVIPLQAPQWQRPDSVTAFRSFMHRVQTHADLVIYNSQDTRRHAEAVFDIPPSCVVAHLGIEIAPPAPLPPGLAPGAPYFLCLGTIEPRKNHALLLDIWDDWGAEAPQLVLAGQRGWANDAVFARLDRAPPTITHAPGLSDGQITTLMQGAHGLLFPSHLEGFGLPPVEAAAQGLPVICNPLPVLREILGDIPIYASTDTPYLWRNKIERLAEQQRISTGFEAPTWEDHFNKVLTLT